VVDDCTKESIVIEVDTSLSGERVVRVLDRIAEQRPSPRNDLNRSRPGVTTLALDAWDHVRGVKLAFIQHEKPTQNAYIESFYGRIRDECLNDHCSQP
jgi:putative transposase